MNNYDPDGKCIKCGGEEIEDEYRSERNQADADALNRSVFIGNPLQPHPEHIVRACKNCDFSWKEAPLVLP